MAGTQTQPKPVWDLNPRDLDSNPAKTQGTWFQDLMKLRFLMSHRRKNSVRDKVIGKKWIYSDTERRTLHRESAGYHRGWLWPWSLAWLVFIGWVISYANKWEDYSNYFGDLNPCGWDRGWDGWMALSTRWTWVWASFGNWWWTGKPGALQSVESQGQTQLSNWTELII